MCRVLTIANQKGGVAKTTSTVSLGIGLAREGKKVLLIDADAQGSLTASLGYQQPDQLEVTLATIMDHIVNEETFYKAEGILHHEEGVDLLPANIELSGIEVSLVNIMCREAILKEYIAMIESDYDYILIDCSPSLGMITINALVCAHAVIIPVQAEYLPIKGLEQLIRTIGKVRRQMNRQLKIEGILLTMMDYRTNYAKDITELVKEHYGCQIKIFETSIPRSVRAAETSAMGVSIYAHDASGKVARAYEAFTREVLANE